MAKLTLMGDGSGSIDLVVPAAAGTHIITLPSTTGQVLVSTVNLTFPTTSGTNGQVLTTNGSGTLSWTTPAAGGVTSFAGGTTGLLPAGATTGAVSLSGTLNVANGGTGLTALGAGVVTALGLATNGANGFAVMNGSGVLDVTEGGTGLAALGTNVQTALGTNANAAGGFPRLNGSGAVAIAQGGTGLTALGAIGDVLTINPAGTAAVWAAPVSTIAIGTTTVTAGTPNGLLFDNSGVAGTLVLGTGVFAALGNAANGASGLAVMNGSGVLDVVDGGTGLSALGTNVQAALAVNVNAANGFPRLNGSGAVAIAQGGTGLTALGTAGQVLKVNPGVTAAVWANESDILNVGTTSISSGASGAVLYQNGSVLGELAIGTAGQVLTVNPGATAPIWTTPGILSAQAANTVYAGPTTGAAAAPTFRSVVTADLSPAFTSAQSLTSSGYQKLPGGLIIQWGTSNTGAGTVTLTFPTAFTTACQFTTTPHGNSTTNAVLTQSSKTTTSVSITSVLGDTAAVFGNVDFDWIAIGY